MKSEHQEVLEKVAKDLDQTSIDLIIASSPLCSMYEAELVLESDNLMKLWDTLRDLIKRIDESAKTLTNLKGQSDWEWLEEEYYEAEDSPSSAALNKPSEEYPITEQEIETKIKHYEAVTGRKATD
jgi:hypothetical protein